MRLNAKLLILLMIVLLAAPFLLLCGLNLALQSSSVRGRIQSALEKSVGMPISFSGISATLCGGIKVRGVISHGEEGPHFTLESLILYPCYLKLLRQEVVIRELILNHPAVQYSLADSREAKARPLQAASVSSPTSLTVTSSLQKLSVQAPAIPASSHTPSTAILPISSKTIASQLLHLIITDGEFTLLNEQNLPVISIQGINLSGKQSDNGNWNGTLKAEQVTVGSGMVLHDLGAPITLSAETSTLALSDLTATLGGGKLGGKFSLVLPPSAPTYTTQLMLTGASLNQFFLDASLGNSATEGVITGDLQLSGIAGMPRSMEGKGSLFCINAVIQPADFLKQIGQILQIQELQTLRLAEGKTLFRVHQGDVQIDQLSLRSENLILTAQGPVHSNGDLDLQARLLFNEKLSGRLHGFLGPQLTKAPEAGYSQVSFHVSGSAKNPKTDLLERLTGIHINGDLGGFLQGLFGRPR